MNYLITLKCPKKCSFCFSKKINQVMSFDNFKKWLDIDLANLGDSIGILGGEPITHPDFGKFLEHALVRSRNVSVFSNLMAPKKNAEELVRLAAKYPKLRVVWNDSEFDTISDSHQINSLALAKQLNKLCIMSHSVTYTPGLDLSYLLEIADKTEIREVRFALNVSEMRECVTPQNLEILVGQLQLLVSNGFTIHQDKCGFIPNSIPALVRLRLINLIGRFDRCNGNALDILPDGRIIPCSPYLDDIKDVFITDITSREHLHEQLTYHYGPQSSRQVTQGMCPAVYERPLKSKIISIMQVLS